jgi:hypothetical protein
MFSQIGQHSSFISVTYCKEDGYAQLERFGRREDFRSAPPGHNHIQQNQRNPVAMHPEDFNSPLATAGNQVCFLPG